jgi:hypothetical protein
MKSTGRRVALMGPVYLNAIFNELESELGGDKPAVVVEAQRRFTRQGVYSAAEIGDEQEFRKLLALRGMGNLAKMEMDGRRLRASVENATIPLLPAGLMQGYFEDITGIESTINWEVGEDGTLVLEAAAQL